MSGLWQAVKRRNKAPLIAFCLGLLILLPVLAVAMPPVLDYPNHMVRFWLLAGGTDRVARFYGVDWSQTVTNIGTDVLGVGLNHMFAPEITGRFILGLSALLPCIGAALLSRRLYQRLSWWQGLMCLNAWTLTLLCGLMSFQLSLGLALICVSLDLGVLHQPVAARFLRRTVQCLLVALVHPFGAGLYLFVSLAIATGARPGKMTWKARLLAWVVTLLPFAVVALMLVILQHLTAQDSSQTLSLKIFPALQWDDPVWLNMSLDRWADIFVMPWRSYGVVADAIVPILLVVGCIVALIQRRLKWHLGMLAAGAALLLGGIFGPQGIGSTSLIDLRLLTMAALTLSVAVLPDIRFRGAAQILCALAIIAVGARSLWLADIWVQRQTDMQSLYRAMAPIPAGARVLPLMGQVTDDEPVGRFLGDISPSFEHLPALVVLRRHAFVPTLFAERGKQPLTVKSPYDEDNEPSGGVLGTVADLEAHNGKVAAYLDDWPGRFDYILIVNADVSPLPAIPQACLVSDQGFARLYKIGECRVD